MEGELYTVSGITVVAIEILQGMATVVEVLVVVGEVDHALGF